MVEGSINEQTNRLGEALRLRLDGIETGPTALVHVVHIKPSIVAVKAHVAAATDARASGGRATGETGQ